jgi:hypothetical protein
MYEDLCLRRRVILTVLGFYAEHDLPSSGPDLIGNLSKDEEAELRQIASALILALAASEVMPTGVLIASLGKVSKNPSSYPGDLPAAVMWEIASNYQRSDEKPSTNWRDVWGNQPALFEGQAEVPNECNIARAAVSAIGRLQSARRRGRPYNPANRVLADHLGEIFRRNGQLIVRQRQWETRHGKPVLVEGGPFYDFLNLVVPPLQRHLRERELAPVTVDTIVRLVVEDLSLSR